MYRALRPSSNAIAAALSFYATTPSSPEALAKLGVEYVARDLEAAPVRSEPAPAASTFEARDDQHQVADPASFMKGGNATFTVVSKATGARFTFKVRQPSADKPHFVKVLTGPDNTADYVFLGTIFADGTYRHSHKSAIGPAAPSAKAFKWFYDNLGNPEAMARCEVWHEGRCCRCGRALTVPSSIESGIGPECAKKE